MAELAVDNLTLRLTSNAPKRLKIGDTYFDERSVDISGGHSESVKFTTNAEANGPVTVVAQLYTVDGEKYGDEVRFTVNVTEITPTVMLVIAGGVLLLVLAGFRMYTQRKRAAARLEAEGAPTDDETSESTQRDDDANTEAASLVHTVEEERPVNSGTDEPEHPSDPAPNTAPESADPSGTGERVDR